MPLSFMGSVQVATADLEDENKALKEALEKSRGSANAATIRLERDLREATGKVLLLIHPPLHSCVRSSISCTIVFPTPCSP
jgi:hypothetical protein